MEIILNEMQNGIRAITLIGTFDILGTGKIENKFAGYCAGEKLLVVVDLSEVNFLASIGIRLLVLTAKSIASREGKMVIISPIPERVFLKSFGIYLIPALQTFRTRI